MENLNILRQERMCFLKHIDDDKILELHRQGLLQKEIAKELGCASGTVSHHLLSMGIRKRGWIDKDKVIMLHNDGKYDREIAEILGCTRCAVTLILNQAGITGRKSKKNDISLRNRISNSLIGRYIGEDNPNYKGYKEEKRIARGISKTLSKRKMRECDYTCQACGKRGGDMEAHHIKPFSVILEEFLKNHYDGNINTAYEQITNYPEFMDESNLVVLCRNCHHKVHYSDNHELSPYRWESATTIENTL